MSKRTAGGAGNGASAVSLMSAERKHREVFRRAGVGDRFGFHVHRRGPVFGREGAPLFRACDDAVGGNEPRRPGDENALGAREQGGVGKVLREEQIAGAQRRLESAGETAAD